MAAGNFILFAEAQQKILSNTLDLTADAFRMVLVTSAWTPAQNTDAAWSDISASEVANGNGYSTHGKLITLTGPTKSANESIFDGDDQSWTAVGTLTAKYAVIVKDANADGALAATDVPVWFADLNTAGGSLAATDAAFSVPINVAGLYKFTAAAS